MQARKLHKIPKGCKETDKQNADLASKLQKNLEDTDAEKHQYYENIMNTSKLGKTPKGCKEKKKLKKTGQAHFRRIRKTQTKKHNDDRSAK